MSALADAYDPDLSFTGRLRSRLVRLQKRVPAARAPARPCVTFTFDDAPRSVFTAGLPVLESQGVRATIFACMGLAGAVTSQGRLMDVAELREAAARGHEIGAHTHTHRDLSRTTAAQTRAELDAGARAFADAGLPAPTTFAYPYGEVGRAAKAVCRDRFALCRGIRAGRVTQGSDLAQAPSVAADGPEGEACALAALRAAAAHGGWVILFMHQVTPVEQRFAIHPDALARLAAAAHDLGVEPITAAEGARRLRA